MSESKLQKSIGEKFARLRRKKNISLEELSEKTGLKIKNLQDIEEGKGFVPVGNILKISRALTVDPGEFLDSTKSKKKEIVKKSKDIKKREDLYQYTVLTPDAKNKCLRAFRVIVSANSEHPRVNYQHNGEELIYVLKGEIEIKVGQKMHHLKKNDTLLFNSGVKHSLKNPSNKEALLLVAVYTPKV